jgi:hypothetical protein
MSKQKAQKKVTKEEKQSKTPTQPPATTVDKATTDQQT